MGDEAVEVIRGIIKQARRDADAAIIARLYRVATGQNIHSVLYLAKRELSEWVEKTNDGPQLAKIWSAAEGEGCDEITQIARDKLVALVDELKTTLCTDPENRET